MATRSGAVGNLEAIVSLLRSIVSVTIKVIHFNSALQQQPLIKKAWLIAFHLLNRPHVSLRLGSPLLFSLVFLLSLLLCYRCILVCRCLLLCRVELRSLCGIIMKAFLNLFRQFTEIDFRDSRFHFFRTMPSGSTRLTVTFLYSLPLTVLKSSAKTIGGNRMSTIRTFKKQRGIISRFLEVSPNQSKNEKPLLSEQTR
jgi:hypothetical protein